VYQIFGPRYILVYVIIKVSESYFLLYFTEMSFQERWWRTLIKSIFWSLVLITMAVAQKRKVDSKAYTLLLVNFVMSFLLTLLPHQQWSHHPCMPQPLQFTFKCIDAGLAIQGTALDSLDYKPVQTWIRYVIETSTAAHCAQLQGTGSRSEVLCEKFE